MKTKGLNFPWFHLNSFEIIIERFLLRVLFMPELDLMEFQLILVPKNHV